MPIVSFRKDLELQNNAGEPASAGQIDLALLLSEYYGKNIRQGQNFKIKKVSAQLIGKDTGATEDFDLGGSSQMVFDAVPTTKYSRQAWNHVFKQWARQKQLKGSVGQSIRNDDFEVAYMNHRINARTSSLHVSGIGDSTTENVVITGSSSANSHLTLEDVCNLMLHPDTPAPTFPLISTPIKDDKYGGTRFPEHQSFAVGGTNSAMVDHFGPTFSAVNYGGAQVNNGELEFPDPLSVFCGILNYNIFIHPEDTLLQVEDNFTLFVQFHVSSWKPLVYSRKPRRSKPSTRRYRRSTRGRKSSRRKR